MNIQVVFHSATGNTRKVADSIAGAVGCRATGIDKYAKDAGPVDLLFLGAAVYATADHGLHAAVKSFIDGLDAAKARKVALFSTGFIQSEAIAMMRRLLEARGIEVVRDSFFCLGRFALFNLGHPSSKDLDAAGEFARKIAGPAPRAN